jgi:phage terminase large subunit
MHAPSSPSPSSSPPPPTIHPLCPHDFVHNTLKITPWSKITEIIDAVKQGKRKILVRSCNGAGKTTTIAALCNWKLTTDPESIVLTTASSWTQVRRALWGELRKQARLAELYDGKAIGLTNIKLSDKHFALGISPNIPENAQGFHAPGMLIAIDEATGVDREIVNAMWGNATNEGSQMILIYNPINPQSFPFDAEATGDWHLITISAFDHPNVIEGRNIIPGAVTRGWIEDRLIAWSFEIEKPEPHEEHKGVYVPWLRKWYRKTPIVASRILGEWPEDGGEGFILPELVTGSYTVESVPGIRSIGVDVARSGDDYTVIAFFDGNTQLDFECAVGRDTMKTAIRIKELHDAGWTHIAIDDTGIGGGVTDKLNELGVKVNAIHFSGGIKGFIKHTKDLLNTRAELYFLVEQELRHRRIRLLDDRELLQELTAVKLDHTGVKYKMQEKETVKRALGRSPDKADATCLALYAQMLAGRGSLPHFI